ncbi:ankyrin repeat-containing domain protein [Nemania sp. FL0031]|nr:ankyrin repeat-containing domain protein [Nemania sp. FL0031]
MSWLKSHLKTPTVSFPNRGNILHFAASKGIRAVVRELLQHPLADLLLKATDRSGYKPLDVAMINGNEGVIKEILSAAKTRQPQSKTIFRAIKAKRVSVVKLLLDNGWTTNHWDRNKNTLLHTAIDTGQDEIARLLFKRGAKNLLNEKNYAGDSLLHIAVSRKNKHIIRWLLDNGADPNTLNPHTGLSPLHLLCQPGEDNVEEILREFASIENKPRTSNGELCKKTDFSLPAFDGSTALHYAIARRDPGLIRALLEQSPDLNAEVTETRATPLLAAMAGGLGIELIKLLLGPKGKVLDLNKRNSQNKSALDIATDRGEWPIVKELVDAGAEVNPKDVGNNETPLYTAASKGNLQMVEFLLSKGANPQVSGQNSLPAFQVALVRGREDIAKVILESDNFDVKIDSTGYSLGSHLHAAIYTDAQEIFSILVARGANANQSAPPFGKPIHLAIIIDRPFDEAQLLVEALAKIGAQVNDEDLSGRTALSLSVTEYPHSDITYLLNLDADPNLPDRLGATPLHYAAQFSGKDTLERLISKGGDVQRKDNCSRSVLYRAAASGNYDKFITVLKNLPGDCRMEHLASAIYPAIARRAADIVKAILDRTTIHAHARDRNGWTVFEVAEAYGNQELVSQLRQGAEELLELNLAGKIAPSTWNPDDMGPNMQLFEDNMGGLIGGAIELLAGTHTAGLRANSCMVPDPITGISYFEVTILQASSVSVGFSEENASVDTIVGLSEGSWGYRSDNGYAYWGDSSKGKVYGASYDMAARMSYDMAARMSGEEAVVGCGMDFRNKVAFFYARWRKPRRRI